VRLAALDLKRISWVDLEGSVGGSWGFWDSRVSPKFTYSHFHLNVTFPCKFTSNHVLKCTSEFIAVTIPDIGNTF